MKELVECLKPFVAVEDLLRVYMPRFVTMEGVDGLANNYTMRFAELRRYLKRARNIDQVAFM